LVVSSAGKGFWNPEAAALPLTTITAWETFFERLHIDRAGADAGKLLLIIGGAGGVGSIGIQIAKFAGLKVIATASRRETREWCKNLGADYVIDHRQPLKTELEKIGIGQVDYIVNFSNTDLFEKISDNDWSKLIETNFMSGVRLSRFYLPLMKKQDWGRIIFISSESGVNIPSNMIHYGVTKTMQIALARGLAETTAGTAVTVNSIVVGPTSTEGRMALLSALMGESYGQFSRLLGFVYLKIDPAKEPITYSRIDYRGWAFRQSDLDEFLAAFRRPRRSVFRHPFGRRRRAD